MRQKKSIFILTFLWTLSCLGQNIGDTLKIQIKSCRISYASRDSFTPFTPRLRDLIFDDYGNVSKQILHQVFDSTNKTIRYIPPKRRLVNELRISSPPFTYQINLNDSTGDKYSSTTLHTWVGGRNIGQNDNITFDTLLGRPCVVILSKGYEFCTKTWLWKGIVLRQEFCITGDYYYATSVEENYKIKPDEFTVPNYIKIRDLSKLKN